MVYLHIRGYVLLELILLTSNILHRLLTKKGISISTDQHLTKHEYIMWKITPRNHVKIMHIYLNQHGCVWYRKSTYIIARTEWPWYCLHVNTLRPRQHGRHFADDTFKRIFMNENDTISAKISLKFVPKGPINNIPALVQIMAWRLTHICVARPQWVNE